jgi:hypothetical protein
VKRCGLLEAFQAVGHSCTSGLHPTFRKSATDGVPELVAVFENGRVGIRLYVEMAVDTQFTFVVGRPRTSQRLSDRREQSYLLPGDRGQSEFCRG